MVFKSVIPAVDIQIRHSCGWYPNPSFLRLVSKSVIPAVGIQIRHSCGRYPNPSFLRSISKSVIPAVGIQIRHSCGRYPNPSFLRSIFKFVIPAVDIQIRHSCGRYSNPSFLRSIFKSVIPAKAGIHAVDAPPILQCQHILRIPVSLLVLSSMPMIVVSKAENEPLCAGRFGKRYHVFDMRGRALDFHADGF